ncbi:hypothetical protein [Streptomyces sp. NBC_00094]|uniref:hypothetical protein n=1 Tax=Streptomyces sp. NBC_00094 TaxID=2903620 RepID=UPI0022517495|nr:hypothetical protein [Streptomyces sp. NBC_00094]MCX5390618.1 hypothetical protein [Streptomyces sp. NBC_00094]
MSITSPIPALQGPEGTFLRAEGQTLILRRAREEMHIPLRAIEHVRAEGRVVAVELTAPAGSTPSVQRFEGVDEAAAVVFADAVNAALPTEGKVDDGSKYIGGDRLGGDPHAAKALRALKRGTLYATLAVVALCVLMVATGHAGAIILIIPFGFMAVGFLAGGSVPAYGPYREGHLRRHGVTTVAERIPGEPNQFAYMDPTGLSRTVTSTAAAWTIDVAYDPQDPGRVTALRKHPWLSFDGILGVASIGTGLCFAAGVIAIVVASLLGAGGF